jgi:hypothetical protein
MEWDRFCVKIYLTGDRKVLDEKRDCPQEKDTERNPGRTFVAHDTRVNSGTPRGSLPAFA